ncbi:hypothetical protein OAF54_03075 [bacterium]|nr:hypothetical protein [bacterium]
MFDGDESNFIIANNPENKTEVKHLSMCEDHIVNKQSSITNITCVQDTTSGAYLLTKDNIQIEEYHFNNIITYCDFDFFDKLDYLKNVMGDQGVYCGYGLISMLLPNDFNYSKQISKGVVFEIKDGVVVSGYITKEIIGKSRNTITQILHNEYPYIIVKRFIDNLQYVVNQWLGIHGFSIGLKDCLSDNKQQIDYEINKQIIDAKNAEENISNPLIREITVNSALNKAKDVGLKIAKDSLKPDNGFLTTVISKSKGDFFNICQITGLLSQQIIFGERVPKLLNNNTRTMYHYPMKNISDLDRYKSRGFITNSFYEGLGPREFFFHAMSGREGIINTGSKTKDSGYIEHKLVKNMEDLLVQYDGTVRNSNGDILQFKYNDGYDPCYRFKTGGKNNIINIKGIVDKLNKKYKIEKHF